MSYQAIKARYEAAFDAYHGVALRNAQRALTGDHPSAAELQEEQATLGVLEEARRALMAALGGTMRDLEI